MSTVAIVGAGPLGGALTDALARRARISEVRLIDPQGRVAEGKALDILQSAPVEGFNTRITSATDVAAAAGADVIVLADLLGGGDISGEPGLALVRDIARMERRSPLLFAAGTQHQLLSRAASELHVAPHRIVGTAPLALESAVAALVAALADVSPRDLSIGIAGVPPRDAVIGWDAATAYHRPVAEVLPAHQMSAMTTRLPALWPPAPYALASAAARVAEALVHGSRRRFTCFAAIDVSGAGRNVIAAVPVEFVRGGVGRTLEPALSRHERTAFENGLR